jgi:fatty-acid desaturase
MPALRYVKSGSVVRWHPRSLCIHTMDTLADIAPSSEAIFTETLEADSRALTQSRSARVNWNFAFWLTAFHVAALAAFFCFSWSALAVFLVLWILGQNVGIGMSYHRLLTHRGYSTPKWLEYLLAVCGTLALQGGPIYWVAVHRLHHQLTDRPGDPHSPRDGGWWSHTGWILNGTLRNRNALLNRYAPDLTRDPFYVWLSRFHWVPVTLVGIGLYFAGGWPWVLWGIFLRVTLGLHVTWLVNSATHMWGSRRFETRDDSRNNWWVALLTGGEGWHNNHHAHPVSARHGMAWYEVDVNYLGIRLLGFLGLARRIKIQGVKPGPARVIHS